MFNKEIHYSELPIRLIADSGSTKTDWIIMLGRNESKQYQTIGLNPFYMDTHSMINVLEKDLAPFIDKYIVREVFFYGAGCGSTYKAIIVDDALKNLFPNADISIFTDLMGSARAMFGKSRGIAAILGTGSNSCYYDGIQILETVPSLGYFFGDEGSGAYIGKTFLRELMKGNVPKEISLQFEEKYNYDRDVILDTIYKKPNPNKFLSSFTEFFIGMVRHEYLSNLVASCFRDFFRESILKYTLHKEVPVRFSGSVAFHFSDILLQVAEEYRINVDKIEKTVIGGMAEYHKYPPKE